MNFSLVFGITALLSLVPASILPFRRTVGSRDILFWLFLGAAVAGPVAFSVVELGASWQTGLSAALWVSIAASTALFAVAAAATRHAWQLTPLLLPYLCLLGILAIFLSFAPESGLAKAQLTEAPESWLAVHIAVSVATYALATLAAVAGAAVFLQERALRQKEFGGLSRLLPSVAHAERLEVGFLILAELVLGVGILTGMSLGYLSEGHLLPFDHKTIFAFLAFAVIGALLLLHHSTGLRGRRAARGALLAYLLLSLAYLGVKFVTDVLIA